LPVRVDIRRAIDIIDGNDDDDDDDDPLGGASGIVRQNGTVEEEMEGREIRILCKDGTKRLSDVTPLLVKAPPRILLLIRAITTMHMLWTNNMKRDGHGCAFRKIVIMVENGNRLFEFQIIK
jgi:hypothetical protein